MYCRMCSLGENRPKHSLWNTVNSFSEESDCRQEKVFLVGRDAQTGRMSKSLRKRERGDPSHLIGA